MSVLITTINDLAADVLPALWRASWQGGLALLLVFVLCRAVRRIPAQGQCWLWRLSYIKLLIAGLWIVPVELHWLPPQEATPVAMPAADSVEPSPPPSDRFVAESPDEHVVVTAPTRVSVTQPVATPETSARLSRLGWLLIAWMVGVTFVLANLTRHGIRVRRLVARFTPLAGGPVVHRLSEHCRQMRIGRPPEVRLAEGDGSPFLVGLLRPVIVLPAAVVDSCTADELDAVVVHELAHIRRRDLLWNWLPAVAETVFFFHPLLWLTRREWRVAQEIATDELAVTAAQLDVARYARSLIDVVSKSPDAAMRPHLAVALSEAYSQLARRMQAMQSFQPLTRRRTLTIAATLVILAAIALVPWKLTAWQSGDPAEPTAGPDRAQGTNRADHPFNDRIPAGALVRLGDSRLRQEQGVEGVAFTPDGTQLVSMGWEETIHFWDVETAAPVRQLETDQYEATFGVAFSPDGTKMASVGDTGKVRLWDLATGKVIAKTQGHTMNSHGVRTFGVAFSADGTVFATAGSDPSVVVWDGENGVELRRLDTGVESYDTRPVAFSPDGRYLASGSAGGTIFIWDLENGGDPRIIRKAHGRGKVKVPSAGVVSLAITPDGRNLISSGCHYERVSEKMIQAVSEIRIWDIDTGRERREFQSFRKFLGQCAIALSRDGTLLASAHRHEVVLWDVKTRRVQRILKSDGQDYGGRTHAVAISPDNKLIAAKARGSKVRMWSVETGEEVHAQRETHKGAILSVAFSPDGRTVATGAEDAVARVWDAEIGKQIRAVGASSGWIRYLEFFPGGDRIALGAETRDPKVGGFRGEVKIARVEDGELLERFPTSDRVMCGALSPDGRFIAAGVGIRNFEAAFAGAEPSNFTIPIWDTRTGKSVHELKGHTNVIWDTAFAPDGDTLWSVSEDRTARKWNLKTGKETLRYDLEFEDVARVFDPAASLAPQTSRLFVGFLQRTGPEDHFGRMELHDLSARQFVWRKDIGYWYPTVVEFSHDERLIAVFLKLLFREAKSHRLVLVSAADGRELKSFGLRDARVRSLAFSPDDTRLVTGMETGDALIWDVSDVSRPVD